MRLPVPLLLHGQVYDAKKGAFTELGMLDVQQIFGRAGRPQFDTSGEANIITAHSKLAHYLGKQQASGHDMAKGCSLQGLLTGQCDDTAEVIGATGDSGIPWTTPAEQASGCCFVTS